MVNNQFSKNFLYGFFQNSKVGNLVKGIIHNLNSPIQILSMHIEMLKIDIVKGLKASESARSLNLPDNVTKQLKDLSDNLHRGADRISEMEDALVRIENIVNVINNRSQGGEDGKRPIILKQVLEEELDFWNADLFFKHQVEKHLISPSTPIFTVIKEAHLRDLIDVLLDACITQMQETEKRDLKITSCQKDEAAWSLEFEHTGNAFPTNLNQDIRRYSKESKEYTQKTYDHLFLILNLNIAKFRTEQIGGTLEIEPQKASCIIPNKQ